MRLPGRNGSAAARGPLESSTPDSAGRNRFDRASPGSADRRFEAGAARSAALYDLLRRLPRAAGRRARGFPAPPSFHEERLRQAGDDHFYSAIRDGAGRMWPYADRLPERDRWAVVAYVRALQMSRRAQVGDLPADLRGRLP